MLLIIINLHRLFLLLLFSLLFRCITITVHSIITFYDTYYHYVYYCPLLRCIIENIHKSCNLSLTFFEKSKAENV